MLLSETGHILDLARVTQPKLMLPVFTDIAQKFLLMGLKTQDLWEALVLFYWLLLLGDY